MTGRPRYASIRGKAKDFAMDSIVSKIVASLEASRDYWAEASSAVGSTESLDGILPASRALPECLPATELIGEGRRAWQELLHIAQQEESASSAFKNAVFLLMYFDSLFVYRALKVLYKEAVEEQRLWLDVACRKILLRSLEVSEKRHHPLTREIVRNTGRGRLTTTPLIVQLARNLSSQWGRSTIIRDMAVSDGVTCLDLAEEAAARGVAVSITGTDLLLYLGFAESNGNEVVAHSDGVPCQYLIEGLSYGGPHPAVPEALKSLREKLDQMVRKADVERITMLSPQVEHALETRRYDLSFREEDVFDPDPDIRESDIIRIANLFVERTADHRGYYCREDILKAISRLGQIAKNGAHLYLNNFRKKIEHVGLWRKDGSARVWVRLDPGTNLAADLDGVDSISIDPLM